MDEKRELEILRMAFKLQIRKKFSLNDIANIKREIGNIIKEPELEAIGVTKEELLGLSIHYLKEVFEGQMLIHGLNR